MRPHSHLLGKHYNVRSSVLHLVACLAAKWLAALADLGTSMDSSCDKNFSKHHPFAVHINIALSVWTIDQVHCCCAG